jgi:hypothetical protein
MYFMSDEPSNAPFWQLPLQSWRLKVALVAIVLCLGTTSAFYAAGLFAHWLFRRSIAALFRQQDPTPANISSSTA